MKRSIAFLLFFSALVVCATAQSGEEIIQKLKDIAIIERKVMIPMRDGVRLSTNIYRPETDQKVPVIIFRHPYNFSTWVDGQRRYPRAETAYEAVKRGYAFVLQNERGRFFLRVIGVF